MLKLLAVVAVVGIVLFVQYGEGNYNLPLVHSAPLVFPPRLVPAKVQDGAVTYVPPKPLAPRPTNAPAVQRQVWKAPPEEPLPKNGEGVFYYQKTRATCRLKIVPDAGQNHAVVKIEAVGDSSLVCWFFIPAGQSTEIVIPPSSYRVKLAYGPKWYGERYLFGPDASYSIIEQTINAQPRGEVTLNLYPDIKGTLKVNPLAPEDF